MVEAYKKIPQVLQKQILIRLAGSGLGVVMLLLILAYRGDWRLIIPGIAIFLAFAVDAALLFHKCKNERYVVIQGICQGIDRTGLRKRIKAAYVQCEDKCVKITHQLQKIRNLSIGDKLTVYVSENTPVYEHDGCLVIFNVIAVGKEW